MSAPEPVPHGLNTVADCFGIAVRLTEERMAHILEHPEMKAMGAEIDRLLAAPQIVLQHPRCEPVQQRQASGGRSTFGLKREPRAHHSMSDSSKQQLGNTLWAIADQLRGAMNADDFRDDRLAFLFLRYRSDNYKFEVSEKPSKSNAKVRQKFFQVLIDISCISLIEDPDQRRYFDNVRKIVLCCRQANTMLVSISAKLRLS